jgi:hypothetical protein
MSSTLETIPPEQLVPVCGGFGRALTAAINLGHHMGLRVVTGGTNHVPGSYHFSHRAADFYGPPAMLRKLYGMLQQTGATELLYSPMASAWEQAHHHKNAKGYDWFVHHKKHVHVAYR